MDTRRPRLSTYTLQAWMLRFSSQSTPLRFQEVHYVPPNVLHAVRSWTNLDASMKAILVLGRDEVRLHQDSTIIRATALSSPDGRSQW